MKIIYSQLFIEYKEHTLSLAILLLISLSLVVSRIFQGKRRPNFIVQNERQYYALVI